MSSALNPCSKPLPRVLVVTSCTGQKRHKPKNQLQWADFKDRKRLKQREAELIDWNCPAVQMYTGSQHKYLMEGVRRLRQSLNSPVIDVVILSAGYGLITENQVISPYEMTFNTMKGAEIETWSKHLKINKKFESTIANYDLIFILLGEEYLRSLSLPVKTYPEQTLIFLASQGSRELIQVTDAKTFVYPLSNTDASRMGCALIGLKGFLFKQFASAVISQPDRLQQVKETPDLFPSFLE